MNCTKCDIPISKLHNHGSNDIPLCYNCSVPTNLKYERKEIDSKVYNFKNNSNGATARKLKASSIYLLSKLTSVSSNCSSFFKKNLLKIKYFFLYNLSEIAYGLRKRSTNYQDPLDELLIEKGIDPDKVLEEAENKRYEDEEFRAVDRVWERINEQRKRHSDNTRNLFDNLDKFL